MTNKLFCVTALTCMLFLGHKSQAQLSISGASFTIESGAVVTVQGNLSSNVDIGGSGRILMKGVAGQTINMNGKTIPNLEIDNVNNVSLGSSITRLSGSLLFTNGKLQLGNNDLILAPTVTSSGMGTSKFVETNGTGYVVRELTADVANSITPVGTGSDYTPLSITNSGSTYSAGRISAQAKGVANPNKHPRTESFLTVYWPVLKSGITGGTTTANGTYVDPTRVTGTEADLTGMFWNGTNWSNTGSTQNAATNTAGATITSNSGDLYAMNTFVLVSPKAFLQGAYNNTTQRMNDRLRNSTGAYVTGVVPASNVLPTVDPYRSAPYNFVPVNDATAENVISTAFANPFADQANADNNIVDWVFLELRNTVTPGNTILQTRSALLQRDGDIVDVDGVSPVYFKKVTPGASYTLTVKHRNHLAMSTNPATFTKVLGLVTSGIDFTTISSTSLMGASNTNYLNNGLLNMLYAGNVNNNTNIRWSAPSSDKDYIFTNILGNNSATVLSNVYSQGDVDLNRSVRWSAPNSDKDYIFNNPLSNNAATVRSQVLPN